jgi:hypothetical protein
VGGRTRLAAAIATVFLVRSSLTELKAMGIKQVLSAPRSPWQRAYVERLIGSIPRECLDHLVVFNGRCLYLHLKSFREDYHHSRTHLALAKDSPVPRPIQMPNAGRIIAFQKSADCIIATSGARPEGYPRRTSASLLGPDFTSILRKRIKLHDVQPNAANSLP